MRALNLTPIVLFSLAVALPACNGGSPGVGAASEPLIAPPASCSNGDPTCNVAYDYPGSGDLNASNSLNLIWSDSDNAVVLTDNSGGILDADGDGVPDSADDCPGPGWRTPCDGDASNDGIYQTLYYDVAGSVTVQTDLEISGTLQSADAYILMDSSGSMGGEHAQLVADLTTGTIGDPVACPSSMGTGLIGALKCLVPYPWIGLGEFREVPLLPHANPYDQTPYHHYLDFSTNLTHLTDAVSSLVIHGNKDTPEAATQAMYSVVTGQGLGPYVPNRGSDCGPLRWGYPCFRDNSLPVIILFTDAPMYNGPRPTGPTYGDPPFNGVLGASALLPPLRMSPDILYSNDATTAWDLGDLTYESVSVMGTNTNFGNNFQTWDQDVCKQCSPTCWSDGRDAVVKFSLTEQVSAFFSGEGTTYPSHNVAWAKVSLKIKNCDPGPGGGDYWGRLSYPALGFAANDPLYIISDASVPPSSSSASRRGPFQLRIQTTAADPSWATADLPVSWTDLETELLAKKVKIISVISSSSALADVTELALLTDSVDQYGDPYIEQIASDGTGLSAAVVDAVDALVNNTRRDITLYAEDNPATAIVDETGFVKSVTATSCPTGAEPNCTGGVGTPVCEECLNGTAIAFEFVLGNSIVTEGVTDQVFDFEVVVAADDTIELTRVPVRVMVPRTGAYYGTGYYQNEYHADDVCAMPPEVPDWGTLTWSGSTSGDSTVEFLVYSANTLEELDTVDPVSILYPTSTTAQSYDIADELLAGGRPNYMPFLRIKAVVTGSSDQLITPVFEGWSMEFNCVPFD